MLQMRHCLRSLSFRQLRLPLPMSRRTSGATMVEGALTAGVFLLLLLFIIDITRYFFVLLVLNLGVSAGVDLASKLEIETVTDKTPASCENFPPNDQRYCTFYKNRVNLIIATVARYANLVSGAPESGGTVRRRAFEHYYDTEKYPIYSESNSDTSLAFTSDIAFIRPGERVKNGNDYVLQVPGRPFCEDPAVPPCGAPTALESWASVLGAYPFAVHLEADFDPITPGLGALRIIVRQYGYRRTRSHTNVGALPTFIPSGSPTPIPTITPTWDSRNPTWTPTATGTATRTRTPTPTLRDGELLPPGGST